MLRLRSAWAPGRVNEYSWRQGVGDHLKTYKFEQRPVFRGGVGCQPVVVAVLPVAEWTGTLLRR